MSPEFEKENREAFDEAEFDRIVNWSAYQPERHLSEGLSGLGHCIGQGIAWFGFWIAVGKVLSVALLKLP